MRSCGCAFHQLARVKLGEQRVGLIFLHRLIAGCEIEPDEPADLQEGQDPAIHKLIDMPNAAFKVQGDFMLV